MARFTTSTSPPSKSCAAAAAGPSSSSAKPTHEFPTRSAQAAGLLTPQQMREKREALRLNAGQVAIALRVPESFVVRWEAGGQIQSRAQDMLLRLFFESAEVRRLLENYPASSDGPVFPAEGATAASGLITGV